MDEPTREEIGDLLRRLVDTAVEMKDRADLPPTDAECLRNEKVRALAEATEALIQCTHDCEKELTEQLHKVDFQGESWPLCQARAALAAMQEVK
jgi:hypothetical protein